MSRCKKAILFGATPPYSYATRCTRDVGHGDTHRGRTLENSSNCSHITWKDPAGFDTDRDDEYAWVMGPGELEEVRRGGRHREHGIPLPTRPEL